MARSKKDGFYDINMLLIPEEEDLDIEPNIKQTLARLLGWDNNNSRFDLIRVDTDGRILVSTSPTQSDDANNSQATVTTVNTTLLSANPNRKQYMIQNLGGSAIYLELGATGVVATSLEIASGATFFDDVYTGVVSAICSTGSADVRIIEWT